MQEQLLQFIWKNGLFDKTNLKDTRGNAVSVIKPGYENNDAGPDFTNALIKIGETTWGGNVEIHIDASQWEQHHHQLDAAYNNVILHVCLTGTKAAFTQKGEPIPLLLLNDLIDKNLLHKYDYLMLSQTRLACDKLIHQTEKIDWQINLENMLVNRLKNKVANIESILNQTQNNWDAALYQLLAAAMGQKTNKSAFQLLCNHLPYETIHKQIGNQNRINALLFGCAGLLHAGYKESYPAFLLKEFQLLKQKHALSQINTSVWKFMRMRPASFPTMRLAQLGVLLNQQQGLFRYLLETDDIEAIKALMKKEPDTYWQTHYRFGQITEKKPSSMGEDMANLMLINAIIPLLFTYGKLRSNSEITDKALSWMEKMPAENNRITRLFTYPNIPCENAGQSQGILELYNNFCTFKRCLQCSIGRKLLVKN